MTQNLSKHERNLSSLIHASTFIRFIIPFGNFILPLIIWTANKKDSEFVNHNGKQTLNFQLSLLLYSVVFILITIAFLMSVIPIGFFKEIYDSTQMNNLDHLNIHFKSDDFKFGRLVFPVIIMVFLQGMIFLINIIYTIIAMIKTNEGVTFRYPISINFLK